MSERPIRLSEINAMQRSLKTDVTACPQCKCILSLWLYILFHQEHNNRNYLIRVVRLATFEPYPICIGKYFKLKEANIGIYLAFRMQYLVLPWRKEEIVTSRSVKRPLGVISLMDTVIDKSRVYFKKQSKLKWTSFISGYRVISRVVNI